MRKHARILAGVAAAGLLLGACGDDGNSGADDAEVEFAGISDGDTVASPVSISFEVEGITVSPAGDVVDGEGHFHVMIDVPCVAVGETIPNDDNHKHFGDGSTSAELELEPGEHTLCLQLGDGAHAALEPTDEITITVE